MNLVSLYNLKICGGVNTANKTINCPNCKRPFEVDIDEILKDGEVGFPRALDKGSNLNVRKVKYIDLVCPHADCHWEFEYPLP